MTWAPNSWKSKPALQQPEYPDQAALDEALEQLAALPPIVVSWEVDQLRHRLAKAQRGESFVLQGGNCAETFAECESDFIASQLKVLLQMSLVLLHGLKRPIVRIGRMAGQYAKPRSSDYETMDGVTLPSFRGDNVNRSAFTVESRTPDPTLLLRGYERSALTLNFVRALVDGGFADLHHPEYWDVDFVRHSPRAAEYQKVVEAISDSLRFMETLAGRQVGDIDRVDFYASHEGLHLLYEQAQTRKVPRRPGWYNLAAHCPWIGMRTADPGGAHVEYFRGIQNPIGMKIGPKMEPAVLVELLERLNPLDQPGRVTLIHRFGHDRIAASLPPLLDAVQRAGRRVVWCCDPMHGNTQKTAQGLKTRHFDHILSELEQAFDIHADAGTYLGGLHIELTGDDVTECTGGARGLDDEGLQRSYKTFVDPRLNYEQALELALRVADRMRKMTGAASLEGPVVF